jgi:hypothetical protein
MKEGSVRRLPALLTAAALATVLASSLTACAGVPGFGGCDPVYQPGDASELVSATGSFGAAPDVDFPTPLIVDAKPQASVLIEGDGDPIPHGGTVDFDFSLSDGKTGQVYGATDYADQPDGRLVAGKEGSSVTKALECTRVGERLALATRAEDAYAKGTIPDGLDPDTTLVFVIDVAAGYLGKADGVNQLPQDGMPNVVTAPDGRPGITVPRTEAPDELRVSTVKAGGHETVKDGDSVVVHFSSFTWPAPGDLANEVDSSWPRIPVNVEVDKGATASAAQGVPPVAGAQLVGVNVGSQVLVVIPPDDQSSDTIIVVIDVLGIQK